MKNVSLFDQISNMRPGDSIDVRFPEGFTVDYIKTRWVDDKYVDVIETSPCTRMNAWYWDEDDHCCKDYYFYNGDDGNWFCKGRSITKESWVKINTYLHTIY